MKKIALFVSLLLVCTNTFAQLKGIVLDADGAAISTADVFFVPLGVSLQTDADGQFNLESILPTSSTIIISKEGFKTQSFNTNL